MEDNHDHNSLMQALADEYHDILENSEQGIYFYLDDSSKLCNKKFAALLGYDSEDEWAAVDESFPDVFVAEESQEALISSFQDAMEKNVASTNQITWKKKDGSKISTTVILAPVSFNGHLLALHFVTN